MLFYSGSGTNGYSGDDGPATSATVKTIQKVTADTLGKIYFADSGTYIPRRCVD